MTQSPFSLEELTSSTDIITPYGTVRLSWCDTALVKVRLGPFEPGDRRPTVRRYMPPHQEGQQLIAQILAYFQGREIAFSTPLSGKLGTEFQCQVWQALREIPYGKYESYGDLALRLGLPISSARAVGNACSQNPLLIIFPCHRVVASTGVLTGYSAGIAWKRALLELEGVSVEKGRVRIFKKHRF